MKQLYDKDAIELDSIVQEAIKPLVEHYINQGYSLRDIQTVTTDAVREVILCKLIGMPREQCTDIVRLLMVLRFIL